MVEDQVLDFDLIISTMQDSCLRMQEQCLDFAATSFMTDEETWELEAIIGEFDEFAREAKMLSERAIILKAKAKSTAKLVGIP